MNKDLRRLAVITAVVFGLTAAAGWVFAGVPKTDTDWAMCGMLHVILFCSVAYLVIGGRK